MKGKKQNKRIGIVLDKKNYEDSQYLWLPLAKNLVKEGAEIWLLPDVNFKFLNANVFNCIVTFSPTSHADDFFGIPFLTIENKIQGHPNISFVTNEQRGENEILKVKSEQFVSIAYGIITKLLDGAENILNRSCQATYESAPEPHLAATPIEAEFFFDAGGINEKEKFYALLKKYFPELGIDKYSIILNERIFPDLRGSSKIVFEKAEKEKNFSENEILPEDILDQVSGNLFDLRALQNFDEAGNPDGTIGYFISEMKITNSASSENISFVSGKTIDLLSKTIKTVAEYEKIKAEKEDAEKSSYEKTEFFANMGSDLCDPLEEISAKISQIEENIEKDLGNKNIILEQLLFLKSQIEAQLEKTRTLVELSATQLDDFELEKKLFNPEKIFPPDAEFTTEKFPLLFGDAEKIKDALVSIAQDSKTKIKGGIEKEGVFIEIESTEGKNFDFRKPKLALAEKILLLHYAEIEKAPLSCKITIPYPNLSCQNFVKPLAPLEIYSFSTTRKMPKFNGEKIFELPVKNYFEKGNAKANLLYWEADNASADEWVKIYSMRKEEKIFKTPIICFSEHFEGKDFLSGLEEKFHTTKTETVLFINTRKAKYGSWATEKNSVLIPSADEFETVLKDITPSLIVFEKVDKTVLKKIRKHPKTVTTPILVIPEDRLSEKEVEVLCEFPKILFCNHGACESKEFNERVLNIIKGEEILPPHTGALVKKAILYLNENYSQQIVRWKLADSVHVSEDYLTRVFHQELGLSLWEYLSRYRIFLATRMLLETNNTIYEIAEKTGFQDQAYFCRVFKKIYGIPPGKVRSR